ncbi:MAG: NYN domain-containing protein [Oscillospiraceae bacterium]
METDLRFAVLIDAENFSSKYVKQIFDEIAEDGHASIRRVYGGWTSPQLKPWRNILEAYSISTRQECCYSYGKSSADSAMIIDAMDILYSGAVDGFCIASSDGDFTNLARRIREAGKQILGAGENKTPKAFVNSCNKFIYVDMLDTDTPPEPAPVPEPVPDSEPPKSTGRGRGGKNRGKKKAPVVEDIPVYEPIYDPVDIPDPVGPTSLDTIKDDLVKFFEGKASRGMEKRAYLGAIGAYLRKKHPDFDCRNYKCKTLAQLLKTFDEFDVEELVNELDPKVKAIYVVCKSPDID